MAARCSRRLAFRLPDLVYFCMSRAASRKIRRSNLKPVEKRILEREWKRGAQKKYICKVLNISGNTLIKQRKRLGLDPRRKEPTENTHFVGFYVTPELDRAIRIFAQGKGLSKSDWLRSVVQHQLKG